MFCLATTHTFANAEKDAATELFSALNMDQLLVQKALSYKKQMEVLLENSELSEEEKKITEKHYATIIDKIIEFMRSEEVLKAFRESYAETFTESELYDLVKFYESPTGRKFLSQSGNLNATFMKKIGPKFNALLTEFESIEDDET
jgi:hypothetical protein